MVQHFPLWEFHVGLLRAFLTPYPLWSFCYKMISYFSASNATVSSPCALPEVNLGFQILGFRTSVCVRARPSQTPGSIPPPWNPQIQQAQAQRILLELLGIVKLPVIASMQTWRHWRTSSHARGVCLRTEPGVREGGRERDSKVRYGSTCL